MPTEETYRLAQCLMSMGKTVHDHVMKLQAEYLTRHGRYRAHTDLSLAQYHAVSMVHDCGPVTITELAGILGVSAPSASAMVDRLVEKGVLSREHSTEDRRKVIVCIAEKAVENVESVYEGIRHAFVDVVDKIGLDKAQDWCDILQGVREALMAED
jgi:DNA-binding MarR family transcriptional regulator